MVGLLIRFCVNYCTLTAFDKFIRCFKDDAASADSDNRIIYVLLSVFNCSIRYFLSIVESIASIASKASLVVLLLSIVVVALTIDAMNIYKFAMVFAFVSIGMAIQFQIYMIYSAYSNTAFVIWDKKRYAMMVIFLFAFEGIIRSLCYLYGHRQIRLKALSHMILLGISICTFVLFMICVIAMHVAVKCNTMLEYWLSVIVIAGVFVILYIMLYLIKIITHYMNKHFTHIRCMEDLKHSEKHLVEIESIYIQMKDLKHNMKNQLLELEHLIEERNWNIIYDRLRGVVTEIDLIDSEVYSGNAQINSILRTKLGIAKNRGINVEADVMFPSDMKIKDGIMGIILGNLLDNAIEACDRMNLCQKRIRVKVQLKDETIYIVVENSKDANENSKLESLKEDKENHGIGIRSVKSVFDRHGGYVDFRDDGEVFVVVGVLNLNYCLVENN